MWPLIVIIISTVAVIEFALLLGALIRLAMVDRRLQEHLRWHREEQQSCVSTTQGAYDPRTDILAADLSAGGADRALADAGALA